MFHEMGNESRAALAAMLVQCQEHIVAREGVKPTGKRWPEIGATTEPELTPGSLHAYGLMDKALAFINAPEVTESDKIGGKVYLRFRHQFGCFGISASGHNEWGIAEHFMESPYPLWTLRRERESYWLTRYRKGCGDGTPVLVLGDSWLAVIEATRNAD